MISKQARTLLLLLGILSSPALTDSAKVKRVKAGKVYKEHAAVHLVVNKVG
jgi:hypothetical protein